MYRHQKSMEWRIKKFLNDLPCAAIKAHGKYLGLPCVFSLPCILLASTRQTNILPCAFVLPCWPPRHTTNKPICRVPVFWLAAKWGHTATEPFPVVHTPIRSVHNSWVALVRYVHVCSPDCIHCNKQQVHIIKVDKEAGRPVVICLLLTVCRLTR